MSGLADALKNYETSWNALNQTVKKGAKEAATEIVKAVSWVKQSLVGSDWVKQSLTGGADWLKQSLMGGARGNITSRVFGGTGGATAGAPVEMGTAAAIRAMNTVGYLSGGPKTVDDKIADNTKNTANNTKGLKEGLKKLQEAIVSALPQEAEIF